MSFRFLEDTPPPLNGELATHQQVITGHSYGIITVNLAEADPASREQMREQLNALNRSMGQPDACPFVLSPRALEKLQFVNRLVGGYRQDHGRRRDSRTGRPGSGARMP